MIISMKPVGLLNTDNVRRIDGLGRVTLRGEILHLKKVEVAV